MAESMAGWRSSWAYVDDVAAAVALAVTDDRAAGRTFVLSEASHPTMEEIAVEIAARIGWQGKIIRVPDHEMPPAMQTDQHLVAASSRIRAELGYTEVTTRDDALERTIELERHGGPPMDAAELDYGREDALTRQYG